MPASRKVHARRRGDQGAVLVEAVFVLPVVIFIVLSIFEFGLLMAAQSTTQSATRDGVRYASANYAVSGSNKGAADQIAAEVAKDLSARLGYDTPIRLIVYKADPNGDPIGGYGPSSCQFCYRYSWDGATWLYDTSSPQWLNPLACINLSSTDSNAGLNTLDSIGAYVELNHAYVTGAFGSSKLLKEHTVSRLEPLPAGQC